MKTAQKHRYSMMYSLTLSCMTINVSFQVNKKVLLLSENLKGVVQMRKTNDNKKSCPYCGGNGYFQLLLGGSETCGNCSGTGKS